MTAPRDRWSRSTPFQYAVGIEDTFIPQEGPRMRRLDEYELMQHYQFWETDLDLVVRSGASSLRWGVPWYRVEPEPGRFEWDWVDRVVDGMCERGLTCIVDLMHYGTPLWMADAFLDPDYPQRVAAYTQQVVERFQDRLHVWTPLNEPVVNAEFCGQNGLWPPYRTGDDGFTAVAVSLAEGIVRTQSAIREAQPDATIAAVEAGFRYTGDIDSAAVRLLLERRFVVLDLALGAVGADHPLRGWLREHGAADHTLDWLVANGAPPDVLGVNYYPASTTLDVDAAGGQVSTEGGVAGLVDLLRTYNRRYDLPLMVTETSVGGDLGLRRSWLRESMEAVEELRREGLPVIGYTWFPFTSLIDWAYRESTTPVDDWVVHMGMVDLVRTPGGGALERHPTELLADFASLSTQDID